jgi:hypothetical protein
VARHSAEHDCHRTSVLAPQPSNGRKGGDWRTDCWREREREREREERKKREKKMGGDDGASVACDDGIVARLGALEVHT